MVEHGLKSQRIGLLSQAVPGTPDGPGFQGQSCLRGRVSQHTAQRHT
ncbi:hypothetical protein Pan265_29130 [Mucisphaera calidilacus]|uniref:Uncharacterized protein n=1 Tax=Mucisphaera calidilacus TaxID=2527982 RepID=A0A518C1E0_9BACT|nr:hypothetical protein Pan265_29130 [Mucisphaera calidilacus]